MSSYLSGETPVPCLACNTDVKFDALFRRARALGCEAIATGHYARIETDPATGEARLLKARDLGKDQTYFLYDLTPEQLSIARFPLGELMKSEVREIAREAGLPNWDKPDSQEICFVPAADGPAGFIRREAEALGFALPGHPASLPGPVVRADGTEMGTHPGTMGFTVGQRRGLGIATGEPLYVVGIEAGERRLVVGGDGEVLSREVSPPRAELPGAGTGGAVPRPGSDPLPAPGRAGAPGAGGAGRQKGRKGAARLRRSGPGGSPGPGRRLLRPGATGATPGWGADPGERESASGDSPGVREHLRGGMHGVGSPREGGGRRVCGLVQEVSTSPPAW